MTDLISRADVLKYPIRLDHYDEVNGSREFVYGVESVIEYVESLPSAEAESDDLIIKGAKGIKDGLYNIKDGKLFQYKAKGGTVRTYQIVPSADTVSREFYNDAVKANIRILIENEKLKEQIESAEAVQGEWIPFDRTFGRSIWVCSACENSTDVPCDAFTQKPIYDYCPNCGARMKGGAE